MSTTKQEVVQTVSDSTWREFLDTPVAQLEEYGVDERHLNMIEFWIGLYVKDLRRIKEEELRRIPYFKDVAIQKLKAALRLLLLDLKTDLEG